MAKYHGTAGCGHDYEIQLFGPMKSRDKRLDWMNSPEGMCNACYSQKKRKEEQEEQAKQADFHQARIQQLVAQGLAHIRPLQGEAREYAISQGRRLVDLPGDADQREAIRLVLAELGEAQ